MSDRVWAWNAQSRAFARLRATESEWDQLLLLCHNCQDSALASEAAGKGNVLLLPDRDRTFAIEDRSPFSYDLQPVERILLDDEGAPIGSPETVEMALVQGTTPAAQATIDYFTLNTPYYDPAGNVMRIPHSDYLSLVDRRVDLRTEAWQRAAVEAEKLKQADDPHLQKALRVVIAQMIEGRGFWSTWATVLWRKLGDRATLAELLMPPVRISTMAKQMTATTTATATGRAGQYPATRSDWLS